MTKPDYFSDFVSSTQLSFSPGITALVPVVIIVMVCDFLASFIAEAIADYLIERKERPDP